MATATKTESLIEALLKAQSELPDIKTDSQADTGKFKYKYASLPELLKIVLPILHKNNLLLTQMPVTNAEGAARLETTIWHTSGETLIGSVPLPTPHDWQAWGSAITYARRYSLTAMLGIAPDADDDASNAQGFSQAPRTAPANGKPGARNLASQQAASEKCPEHGQPWAMTARGSAAHPIRDEEGKATSWCDKAEWLAANPQNGELAWEEK